MEYVSSQKRALLQISEAKLFLARTLEKENRRLKREIELLPSEINIISQNKSTAIRSSSSFRDGRFQMITSINRDSGEENTS